MITNIISSIFMDYKVEISGMVAIYMVACTLILTSLFILEFAEYIKTLFERK